MRPMADVRWRQTPFCGGPIPRDMSILVTSLKFMPKKPNTERTTERTGRLSLAKVARVRAARGRSQAYVQVSFPVLSRNSDFNPRDLQANGCLFMLGNQRLNKGMHEVASKASEFSTSKNLCKMCGEIHNPGRRFCGNRLAHRPVFIRILILKPPLKVFRVPLSNRKVKLKYIPKPSYCSLLMLLILTTPKPNIKPARGLLEDNFPFEGTPARVTCRIWSIRRCWHEP